MFCSCGMDRTRSGTVIDLCAAVALHLLHLGTVLLLPLCSACMESFWGLKSISLGIEVHDMHPEKMSTCCGKPEPAQPPLSLLPRWRTACIHNWQASFIRKQCGGGGGGWVVPQPRWVGQQSGTPPPSGNYRWVCSLGPPPLMCISWVWLGVFRWEVNDDDVLFDMLLLHFLSLLRTPPTLRKTRRKRGAGGG